MVIDIEGGFAMTLATAFLATALFVPSMPPPEYDDCEVVTNCVFDASRGDAKMFVVLVLRTQTVRDAAARIAALWRGAAY